MLKRRNATFVAGALVLLASLGAHQQFPEDVPAREILLGDLFAGRTSFDEQVRVFANTAGEAVVLVLEDYQLQSLRSGNGGATFSSEAVVAGGAGQPLVHRSFAATLGADGAVHVAFRIADPDGDVGLQIAHSTDMGLTWTAPVDLARDGAPGHGVEDGDTAVAANANGRVAVAFNHWWGYHPYVRVSSDGGSTWEGAVRVDPGGSGDMGTLDVAVDAGGIVHVVFDQNRGAGREIFYARSTDGGQSFEAERSLTPDLPPASQASSRNPDLEIAADGSVLVALWDAFDNDRVYVLRSTDGGQSFATTLTRAFSRNSNVALVPKLQAGGSTVLLRVVEDNGALSVQRSADHGATFSAAQVLASTARFEAPQPHKSYLARTAAGTWGAAWTDDRDDSYFGDLRDLYVRTSTDDGVTWGAEQRVDGGVTGSAKTGLAGIAAVDNDDLLVAYRDFRDDGVDANVYINRSTAANPDFSTNEQRIDADRTTRNPRTDLTGNVATDGVDRSYAIVSAWDPGPYADIFVAASSDAGYSYQQPVRVNTSTPGDEQNLQPQVAALSDGHVYAAYKEVDRATGNTQLRFNRSTDYGMTWQPSDVLLGNVLFGGSFGQSHPEFQLTALADGKVFVLWSDGTDLWLARSTDFGASFTTNQVDQDSRVLRQNGHGALCAQGNQVVLVFTSYTSAPLSPIPSIWGTVSVDGGVNWSTRVDFRTDPGRSAEQALLPHVACGDGDKAVAAWSDRWNGAGTFVSYANRFNGISWDGDVQIAGGTRDQAHSEVDWASSTNVLVTYHDFDAVYTVLSSDGGQNWGAAVQHDDTLQPDALSVSPHLTSDGIGNVWLSWKDRTAGYSSIAVRHSSDAGQSFGTVQRLNRDEPAGGRRSTYAVAGGYAMSAALPGTGVFVWAAQRASLQFDTGIGAHDVDDLDRDMRPTGTDCDDGDPDVWALPEEVDGVTVSKTANDSTTVTLSWTSQEATSGPGTVYDVVVGLLSDLRSSGGFGTAACLGDDHSAPSLEVVRADAVPGDGDYFLVRAQNSCGAATYGDSSLGSDPRDGLDAAGPCP
jgi:hypothetical protein